MHQQQTKVTPLAVEPTKIRLAQETPSDNEEIKKLVPASDQYLDFLIQSSSCDINSFVSDPLELKRQGSYYLDVFWCSTMSECGQAEHICKQ